MKELNHSTDWWFGRKRKKEKNTFIRKEKKIREKRHREFQRERTYTDYGEFQKEKRVLYTLGKRIV